MIAATYSHEISPGRLTDEDVGQRFPEIVSGMSVSDRRDAAAMVGELMTGYLWSEEFEVANAARKILPIPEDLPTGKLKRRISGGRDLGRYFGETARLPLLTSEQEAFYFRRMNFLRWRAEQAYQKLNMDRPSIRALRRIVQDLRAADDDRNFLAEHNLRLVIPLAHRLYLKSESVWDYISEGNAALLRAIRGFDYTRGFRFSTYATWAIVNSLQRLASKQHRESVRFTPTEFTVFDGVEGAHESVTAQIQRTSLAREKVAQLLDLLDARSQEVIAMRFGIAPHEDAFTLKQVGEHFGISKERIRQIEKSALSKMCAALTNDSTLQA